MLWAKLSDRGEAFWANGLYRRVFWPQWGPTGIPFGNIHPDDKFRASVVFLKIMLEKKEGIARVQMITSSNRLVQVRWQGRVMTDKNGETFNSIVGRII